MTVTCDPPDPLIPLAYPEMTRSAPASPLPPGTVLMPLIVDDAFYEYAREHRLPDCAVSFLMRAGTWSARNSRSGFVPAAMLADFSDDPAQVTRTLCSAQLARRAPGGMQILEGNGITVVNAGDVEAEKVKTREAARDRQRRSRANRKAEHREKLNAGVNNVTCDSPAMSHVTPPIDRSNQDQDQSIRVGQVNARTREGPPPGTLASVAAGISKKLGQPVTEAEACRAVAEWNRRADAAGEVIHDPPRYYATCIRKARDLEEITAPPRPAPPPEWLAPEPASGPGVHAFQPDPSPFADACAHPGCGLGKTNARHLKREAGTG